MNTSAVRYWLLLVGLLVVVYATFVLWRRSDSRVETPAEQVASVSQPAAVTANDAMPPTPVADFVLTDSNAEPFDSASLHGQVWVASFFFTNCPSICWRMNQALAAYQQTHPDSAARFVSITCDPDNDTPEALARYAAHFKADPARWTFLTGDMKKIEKIGQESFKIALVEKEHSDRACVVDKKGQVRGRFRLTEPDQVQMLEKLLEVLEAEQPEPDAAPATRDDAPAGSPQDDAAESAPAAASS